MKPDQIPANGLRGQRLREAQTTELRALMDVLRGSLRQHLYGGQDSGWVDVIALYPDKVVVLDRASTRQFAYPYTLGEDNTVTWGEPMEVAGQHVPVGAFREALNESGTRWRIRVIEAGESINGNHYPAAVLREATGLFNGARVFVKSDDEHINGKGKDFRNLIGGLSDAQFVEADSAIEATLTVIDADVGGKLREAWDVQQTALFGFSIDADGKVGKRGKLREAKALTHVHSVDLIISPSAGGRIVNLIEAVNRPEEHADMALRERMIEAIKKHKPTLLAGLDTDDDEALSAAYDEALREAQAPDTPGLERRFAALEARQLINGSKLPDAGKARLLGTLADRPLERLTEAVIQADIGAEADYLAKFAEARGLRVDGDHIEVTQDRHEKVTTMLDAFFDPAHKDHRQARSFRECYIEITGDRRVTGRVENCDPQRLREAVGPARLREAVDTTSFGNVLGNAMHRRLVADYNTGSNYDVWRLLTGEPVPVNDFRTNERTRYGGYGDLPAVAEKGTYTALSTPDDEVASYAVTKRGGIETVSLEAIRNDDVSAIRKVPTKMSRAAKRTLAKFALDFIRTNPTIYDAVALFHASHGNLGAAALDATSWSAARLAMLKQAEAGSTERLGIPPKYLWVPSDLEESAVNLFARDDENDPKFIARTAPTVVGVWYWTDANDWAASVDPMDCPTIEIGFLDGNEEPELFIQDMPQVGSLFSNDVLTYKIRHIYGGNVLDYRGLYKGVVA